MSFDVESDFGGGGFFKPAEHEDAVAILFEPKSYTPNVPGQFGPQDQVRVDVTVFNTKAELDALEPSLVAENMIASSGKGIVNALAERVGKAVVGTIGKGTPKPGQQAPWRINSVGPDVLARIQEYGAQREADRKAALDAAPGFDD